MKPLTHLLFIVVVACMITGCKKSTPAPTPGTAAPGVNFTIVCTTAMIGDVARNVLGPRGTVDILIGEGIDPHQYLAKRSDIAAIDNADLVFYNGLLLEGRMGEILKSGGAVAVAEEQPQGFLLHPADKPGHADPHVWMDVRGWMNALKVIEVELVKLDPEGAAGYMERAATYRAQMTELDAYVRGVIASIPETQRLLVTAHDAFAYFGRAYGIEVMGIQGISTESEAGLQDINRLIDVLVERKVGAVFVESSVSEKNVRALLEGAGAKGHTVRIGGTLFSDAMGAEGTWEGTYLGMIDHNATLIARALGGTAPERGWREKLGAAR